MEETRMRCLWLTLADPEPATNGQLIYSRGLIEATRRGGADLCVVGLVRPEKAMVPSDASGLTWRLVDERRQSRRQRLLRSLPMWHCAAVRRRWTACWRGR
jgi:polysaccharide biosynthesis protein PslH